MISLFNLESYYLRLQTKRLGRPCLFLDRVQSTIDVAERENYNTIVVAKEQMDGRGQRTNKWTSPVGCAMASVRMNCSKSSQLGQRLCFLQHIMAVSVALTLEKVDPVRLGGDRIGLKWPNDIFYKKTSQKIGGILVNTRNQIDDYDIVLSLGLNVNNSEPTTCINEILADGGNNTNSAVSIDYLLADIMNTMEHYTYDLTEENFQRIKSEYELRCLNLGQIVLDAKHGTVLVRGVSDEGYLVGEDTMTGHPKMVTKII